MSFDSPFIKEPSDKGKAILEGAFQVFLGQGYAAASMDRIAAAAGVSKSTLYSNFQDKQGLFLALMRAVTSANRQVVFELLSKSDLEDRPDVVLRRLANLMLDGLSNNQPLLSLMRLIIGESERFPDVAKTFILEIQQPMIEQLSLYFSSQTQLRLSDPKVAARVFAGSMVHYLLVQRVLHGDAVAPLDRDRMIDGLIDIITSQAHRSDEPTAESV
ncbi:MAG: TetR/AcrR family transcriptional regulator [Cyanobacteria bacterium P01_H01_bin.162]